ncbi:hypothetical protein NA57DRAFT_61494 [Rhizodiscina lignyota]|uniref:Cupin type-1 domain-containing protein n=1 Tax=Rhizodiscina lignyota TaxID=1504668 RepID=A0A9P4I5L8_9PEZI|nr:hypothetical protein NA57DRAFT_61494 [Rhizodiscina lignyota]
MPQTNPETFYISPTPHVPNSKFPVLVYRNVFSDPTPDSIQESIEKNDWLTGGTWGPYKNSHFHSVTHECYAIYQGSSRLQLGKGPLDGKGGVEVDVAKGDVIVLPAGTAHCSLSSDGGYEYMGLYPKGSPKWDNNWCKAGPEETESKAQNARSVPIPQCDPLYGSDGPLVNLWTKAAA